MYCTLYAILYYRSGGAPRGAAPRVQGREGVEGAPRGSARGGL